MVIHVIKSRMTDVMYFLPYGFYFPRPLYYGLLIRYFRYFTNRSQLLVEVFADYYYLLFICRKSTDMTLFALLISYETR